MGFINIEDIKPDMVLASDLLTQDGRFLLPKGTQLKSDTIKTCKAWGITRADIVGQDQEQVNKARLEAIDPEYIRQAKKHLKPYLQEVNIEHPAMKEIVKIAVERTAGSISWGMTFNDDAQVQELENKFKPAKPGEKPRSALGMVQEQVYLISLPDIFYKIMEVMKSPVSSANHIADIVSKDSSLTARLLKLVNSAFYGFPAKIDSISRAVALLGTKELTSLALGISVAKTFAGIPSKILNMEGFWKHSISCGVYANLIAARKQGLSGERFFVGGLLHDLGKLIMIRSRPDLVGQAIIFSRKNRIPLYQAEKEVLGFDHAQVGGLLCKEWKMPETLEYMVRFHHLPSNTKNPLEPGIIHLANLMAMVAGPGANGEGVYPALDTKAWESLGLHASDLFPMIMQAERQIEDVIHIFLERRRYAHE